jgi:hypothetical protein
LRWFRDETKNRAAQAARLDFVEDFADFAVEDKNRPRANFGKGPEFCADPKQLFIICFRCCTVFLMQMPCGLLTFAVLQGSAQNGIGSF